MKGQEYLVVWRWRDSAELGGVSHREVVVATNAERAINKVRKAIGEEYSFKKSDLVIEEVLRNG